MRFDTPEQVKAWARKAAAADYAKHLPIHTDPDGTTWQVDKNPYTTQGARSDWQRGYDNKPPHPWQSPTANDFDTMFQRGRAMAELIEAQTTKA